jgi:hypothetical protein
MTANGIKEWTVGKGDFHHSDETDYEKKFRRAQKDTRTFETRIKLFFAISGMSVLVILLELVTRL